MEKGASESQKYFKATLNFESDESDIIFFFLFSSFKRLQKQSWTQREKKTIFYSLKIIIWSDYLMNHWNGWLGFDIVALLVDRLSDIRTFFSRDNG